MANKESSGWHKLIEEYRWFNHYCCYSISACSGFIPSPLIGREPPDEIDHILFTGNDLFEWQLTEIGEEYELRPYIEHAGSQITNSFIKLEEGLPEHFRNCYHSVFFTRILIRRAYFFNN